MRCSLGEAFGTAFARYADRAAYGVSPVPASILSR